ncbi:MAG: response regulator transcription factor, partial [Oscillospiraceae bacterium]|nr:response regulator transcription factor [Oscillospiraceae bacterium]
GVDSFWYKDLNKTPILTVLDRTMAGESIYPDTTPTLTIGKASSVDLTAREIEVLRGVVRGDTNQEIADSLFMSAATVNFHIKSLLYKTGCRNRVELAVIACTEGLIVAD